VPITTNIFLNLNPAHDDTKLFDKFVRHKWPRICSTCPSICRSFPHSWLITRVTRRVSLVEQGLPTLPGHLSSPPVISGVRVARSLVFCLMFCRLWLVLLSFFCWSLCCLFCYGVTDSDYPFGIFKLFLSVVFSGYSSFPRQ